MAGLASLSVSGTGFRAWQGERKDSSFCYRGLNNYLYYFEGPLL